jgi:hypothetical protein
MNTEQRLNKLERQNKRMKKGMIGMVLAGISLLVMAQAAPPKVHDLIRAKKIEVVSDKGQTVISLEGWEHGGMISTYNKKGLNLTSVAANDGGDGLITTYNSKGKKLVDITATEDDTGSISTYNSKGKYLVDITATKNGGAITTFDSKGKKLIAITTTKNGGAITTFDSNETELISITSRTNGSGAVVHFNRAGKPDRAWPPN